MPTPQQVVIGGAIVIANELKTLAEDSDISYSFQQAEKKANEDNETCRECPNAIQTVDLPKIEFRNAYGAAADWLAGLFGRTSNWHTARVRLKGRWEYNGCDIAGATFYFGSSVAKLGVTVNVEAEVLSSNMDGAPGCKPCCERSVAIAWKVEVRVKGPLQTPRIFTAFPYMFGDGTHSGFFWK